MIDGDGGVVTGAELPLAVILSEAKDLIQYGSAPAVASKASSSFRSRRGSMDEILRRGRCSSE
jgi:hypothetical protein